MTNEHDSIHVEITESDVPTMSDAEIATAIKERDQILKDYAARTGARSGPAPTARERKTPAEIAKDAADVQNAEIEVAAIRARLKQLDDEIAAWRKQEAAEKTQAEADAKTSRLALGQAQQEAHDRLQRARAASNLLELEHIAGSIPQQAQKNAALADASTSEARDAMKRMVQPWLDSVTFAMNRVRELDRTYRRPLESFSQLTVSTAPHNFPAAVKNKLSRSVYRPAEQILGDLNNFLECGRSEPILKGDTLEAVLSRIAQTGIWPDGVAMLKFMAEKCYNADGAEALRRRIEILTDDLSRLYAEGRANALPAPGTTEQPVPESIPDPRVPDLITRLEAKDEALHGSITSHRPTEAEMGGQL